MNKSVMKVIEGNGDFFTRFESNQLDKGKAEGTVEVYVRELKRLDEWLKQSGGDIESITRFDVQAYMNHLVSMNKAATTIDRIFGTISVLAKHIGRPSIVEDIRRPRKQSVTAIAPKSLDRNQINGLLRDVERDGNLRNIAIIYTLAFTGLRIGELASLNKSNVDLRRNGRIKVIGKGNKERNVPIPKEARYHLDRYLESRQDDNEALFLSNYNKPISKRSAQRIIEKYGYHAHELRHTYCRNLIRKGVDIVTVSQLAGHESIEVTRRYAMASEQEIELQVNNLFE
ncbi:tyrosine-type recombinase/integrase [Planococcus maritimus]|nr:tyrosine-type recombinase/integrase [Planococcus sp. SK3692]MDE4086186.1 tyrosine-type recombinase/integrase [Planococcus maritimus]